MAAMCLRHDHLRDMLCVLLIFKFAFQPWTRGGWLALAAGFAYILWKRTQAIKTFAIIFILGLASVAAETLPNFQSLVDLTLSPSEDAQFESVDDGARVSTWIHEAPS